MCKHTFYYFFFGNKSTLKSIFYKTVRCYELFEITWLKGWLGKITVYGIDNTDISECIMIYQKY